MTTARITALTATALLAIVTVGVSSCSSDTSGAASPPAAAPMTSTAAPVGTEPVDDPTTTTPGEDICAIKAEWDRIDAKLIEANRQSPPAPAYQDAAMLIYAVFPPESIKPQIIQLRDLIPAYAAVLNSGNSDEIAAAADDATTIAGITSQLSAAFSSLCG